MLTADRDKLIVALDVPTYDDARDLVLELGDTVSFYKIGLELLFAEGLTLARELVNEGKRVFLDLKFLDIGNTVERAVANAAAIGVDFLTVHGHDTKTLKAAAKGRGGAPLKVLAVTVLTSLDQRDLDEQGLVASPSELVLKRARLTQAAGVDGVIASGQEAAAVRAACGPSFLIVTPGIRLPGGEAGDQARITTPADAIGAGADHLVVGRPITAATDPKAAAQAFLEAIARG
jgi:orotidine-5'-phosphate decarboxylase